MCCAGKPSCCCSLVVDLPRDKIGRPGPLTNASFYRRQISQQTSRRGTVAVGLRAEKSEIDDGWVFRGIAGRVRRTRPPSTGHRSSSGGGNREFGMGWSAERKASGKPIGDQNLSRVSKLDAKSCNLSSSPGREPGLASASGKISFIDRGS